MADTLTIVETNRGDLTVAQPGTQGAMGQTGAAATYSDSTPEALGTASAGVAAEASRSDHVHGMPSAADVGAAATSHTHALADVTDAGGAAALDVGTGAGTVAAGDDSRLSDARTPTAHTHTLSEVTDSGTAAALDVPATGDAAVGEVVKGSDTRLSDARTPSSTLAHAASHADGGSDELDVADLASGAATVGQAPLADGAGGVAWGDVAAGGGAVDSVNGQTGTVVLANTDVGAAATSHTHAAADISDSTATGRAVVTAADAAAARTAIGAGTSSFDGAYSSLSGAPTLGTAAALDVPATGDAAVGEVVKGSDTRLSDARTPTTHSHTLADVTDSGGAAALDVGTTAGTVAAGDDSRIVLGGTSVQPGDDAADLGSGAATSGHVLTADGAGGASFAAASGGGAVVTGSAKAYATTGKSISAATYTALEYDTLDWQDGCVSYNTTTDTFTVSADGAYLVQAFLSFLTAVDDARIRVLVNGTTREHLVRNDLGANRTISGQTVIDLAASDALTFEVYCTNAETTRADSTIRDSVSVTRLAGSSGGSAVSETLIDAKGDLIAGSAADTAARLAVGTNGQSLIAASGEATGLKWAGDTAWTEPTPATGWANYGSGFANAAYRKNADGIVRLVGLLTTTGTTSAGTTAFTLPSGYRPATQLFLTSMADQGGTYLTRVDINTDGTVVIYSKPAYSGGWVTLAGLSFYADGS